MSNTTSNVGQIYPLLPLRRGVVFPGSVVTLPVGRTRSRALIDAMEAGSAVIAVGVQRDPKVRNPNQADLHSVAVRARIVRVRRTKERMYAVTLEGLDRLDTGELRQIDPYWTVEAHPRPNLVADLDEARLLAEALQRELREMEPDDAGRLARISNAATDWEDPAAMADRVAATLELRPDDQIRILLCQDASERLRIVISLVSASLSTSEMRKKIEEEVRRSLSKDQREAMLRQQLRVIQKQLGNDEGTDSLDDLKKRLEAANLPEDVQTVADKELKRLSSMNPGHAEHHVIRTYLEWLADLPWTAQAEASFDINNIEAKLNEDHYGLKDVKQRILEHMAVLQVTGNDSATILCLHGPPGVGKTSVVRSIAEATGRPYVRIALGGVKDEAEIRGHRRTYVGSRPGRLIHGMKKAKAKNPVILLDEIDKLGRGWSGTPEAALLEVLDPEQNHLFQDHYLEVPYDLSDVLFVCTANALDTLSSPLRDRLEFVELTGYTQREKAIIARRHLIPRQLSRLGVDAASLTLSDEALASIIRDYTREAGVRQLERQLSKIIRAMILQVARKGALDQPLVFAVEHEDLVDYLGQVRFEARVAERTAIPGVATGLAWTAVGGGILFIETSRMPGKGNLEITGKLGDVMKESARAALTYVRSNAHRLGVDPAFLETQDLHIHVPAGAVPKDGPSAGVTMFTALTSLLTGRRVRGDTAMTGECTLRGRVLPVGGIKSKVMAAHRAGITRVILPTRNERDLAEVPDEVKDAMEFIFAKDMTDVLEAALEDEGILQDLPLDINDDAIEGAGSPSIIA